VAEPIFRAVRDDDLLIVKAHRTAAETLGEFRSLMHRLPEASYLAKLRFRDPDLSEQHGKDAFFFLWLSEVAYHEAQHLFSGAFFEVPAGFEKWHAVGTRLAFDPEDIFDWMVNDSGHIYGAFTIRVHRDRLSSEEQINYDSYMGASSYEPATK
jgi:uncharacterized protein YegJ (DUF2314 family)